MVFGLGGSRRIQKESTLIQGEQTPHRKVPEPESNPRPSYCDTAALTAEREIVREVSHDTPHLYKEFDLGLLRHLVFLSGPRKPGKPGDLETLSDLNSSSTLEWDPYVSVSVWRQQLTSATGHTSSGLTCLTCRSGSTTVDNQLKHNSRGGTTETKCQVSNAEVKSQFRKSHTD